MIHNKLVYRDRSNGRAVRSWASQSLIARKEKERAAIWQRCTETIEILDGGTDCPWYYYAKRITDIALAVLLLILLSPLMALIALLITLDSPGPALFVQTRVGARRRRSRKGKIVWEIRKFRFLKFRSMYADADQSLHEQHIHAFVHGTLDASEEGAKFKLKDDPRITGMGHILRRTSLDELPQLFNVLKGEMSLVGPRPVPTYEVAEYDQPHYERLAALPGITGLWQVQGRGMSTFEEMIEMDIDYVRHSSLLSDIKIMFSTVAAVLAGDGAE
jgi:lipopolysaccharide/colanic/teichoic acid biosynthesis glycosyltransferase